MKEKNEESAWQRASASLDATAKIYGYRVDSVHTETFKFLGGLNRNKKEMNSKEENEDFKFVYFIDTHEKTKKFKIYLPDDYEGKDSLENITEKEKI